MNSFTAVIDEWQSDQAFADDHDVSLSLARVWRHRNSIPREYWDVTVASAKRRGIGGVTLELLSELARAKKTARSNECHAATGTDAAE